MKKLVFILLLMAGMAVKADPMLLPKDTPFKSDEPVVVVPLEEMKEFLLYVRNLERAVEKCQSWKSNTKTQEVPSLADRKEN